MKSRRTKPSWIHLEHGRFLSHWVDTYWLGWVLRRERGDVCVTYLPLGSMAVEAGLGSAVAPALPVVHVEVELKVDHLSVELDESVWVVFHRTLREGSGRKGRGGLVVGDGMRRRRRSEGNEASPYNEIHRKHKRTSKSRRR